MEITSERSTIRSVEVRFTIADLKKCIRFKDEDGNERTLPHDAVLTRVTPDPENAPNIWEVVATFEEEVDDAAMLPPEIQASMRQNANKGAIIAVLAANGSRGRGMTDEQIIEKVKKLGVNESPAKKARLALMNSGLVVKVGTRRGRGKTTGRAKAVYKLAVLAEEKRP